MSEEIRIKKEYWPNGQIKFISYYNENNQKSGSIARECYYINGQRHREDGPAIIWYRREGFIEGGYYYRNGQLHREDGPAEIWYREDGSVEREYYYKNDRPHREDGPAKIRYNSNNEPNEAYYLNGVKLDKQKWLKQIGLIKMKQKAEEELEL